MSKLFPHSDLLHNSWKNSNTLEVALPAVCKYPKGLVYWKALGRWRWLSTQQQIRSSFGSSFRRRGRELEQGRLVWTLRLVQPRAVGSAFFWSCSGGSGCGNCKLNKTRRCHPFHHLTWNQILICVSVNRSDFASSVRSGPDRYRCTENLRSSSNTWAWLNAARLRFFRLHVPSSASLPFIW